MLKKDTFSLFLLAFVVEYANGLYFHIAETERKCFIEEIPDETTVLGELNVIYAIPYPLYIIFIFWCLRKLLTSP